VNKLVDLVQQGPSLLGSTFLANVASGLACSKANTWAAELCTALQFVCPDQVWTPHMLQGQPIQVKPMVEAAQRAFRNLLHAHTGSSDADDCPERHSCKYNAHMFLDGGKGGGMKCCPSLLPCLLLSRCPATGPWPAYGVARRPSKPTCSWG
jgi:hypothetical protein